ncbi:MAG: MBL fold metallo-hydrolase [Bacteroidales bacterium]|nr:MBL fold metallo-hydrolase [Bacteroidales bacterium]
MRLTVLTENVAGYDLLAEHGLSYYIECNEKKILFDTGHTTVFLENAKKIGIDITKEIDIVVLSHGHWDHGDGLRFMKNQTLLTHPSAFIKRYHKNDTVNIGLELNRLEAEKRYHLITSERPYKITNTVLFLGEIPRVNSFESKTTTFEDEHGNEDFVPDDSALAIVENDRLVIVTGCSHSGICNITDYAMKVTGMKKVKAILGGFHLKGDDLQTKKTIQHLKQLNIECVYPSHCTELPALASFYNEFGIRQIKTGMIFNF